MDWCDAALRTASESVSQVARCVSFSNAMHSLLNDAPHAKQRRKQLRRFVDGLVEGTSDALGDVLVQLPSLLLIDADEFRLPSVLIAAHFATQSSLDYDGAMYGCFSWRLRQVITRIGIVRDLGLDTSSSDAPGVEVLRASLREAASTAVPLEASQSPLPGVLASLVVLGPDPMSAIDSDTAAGSAFRAMVAAVDRGMLACTSESGTSMRLMHHLERFAEDAPALLVTCIAGGDRVPLISGLRTSVLESMRAYIHAAACCALERDCTRPEAAAAVLIGMAHCGCADLLASDVNSTHAPLGDQNPAHWAVLRATLSGDCEDEAKQIARILQAADVEHPGTLAVASALCGMMRTRMGMMIFCNDPDGKGEFPTASKACAVASERRGRTVLDAVMGSTTGTLDMIQCATSSRMDDTTNLMDELALQVACDLFTSNVDDDQQLEQRAGGDAGRVDESPSRLVARYCAAVQKVCTTWIEADPDRPGTHKDAWPTMPDFPSVRTPQPSEALVAMRRSARHRSSTTARPCSRSRATSPRFWRRATPCCACRRWFWAATRAPRGYACAFESTSSGRSRTCIRRAAWPDAPCCARSCACRPRMTTPACAALRACSAPDSLSTWAPTRRRRTRGCSTPSAHARSTLSGRCSRCKTCCRRVAPLHARGPTRAWQASSSTWGAATHHPRPHHGRGARAAGEHARIG